MLKNFFKTSFAYAVQNILQRGAEFLLLPFFLSIFSTEDYGIISMCTLLITGLTSLFSLSLDGAVSRYYFKYSSKPKLLREFIGTIITFLIVFLIIISIVFLLFSSRIWFLFIPEIKFNPYIFLVILISAIDPINRLFFSLLLIKRDVRLYTIYYNIYFYLKLFSLLIVSFYFKSTYCYFIAYLAVLLFFIPISFSGLRKYIKWGIKISYLKEAISYSIYILPVTFMAIVNSFIDKYVVLNNMSLADVGVYSAGVNLAGIILLLATVMNKAYVSFFIQKYEENKNNFESTISTLSDIYFFIILIFTICVSLFICFFQWALPSMYVKSIEIISLFVFVGASNGLYFYYTNFMSLEQKLVKYKVLGFGLGIVINFPISYYLTLKIGMIGAVIGTLCGFLTSLIVMKYLVVKVGNFKVKNKYIYYLLGGLFISSITNKLLVGFTIPYSILIRVLVLLLVIFFMNLFFFEKKKFLSHYLNQLLAYVKNYNIK